MKKALWVLSALALVGFGFAGCGEEECGDGYECNNDDYCDGQCAAGEHCFGKDEADDRPICSKCSVDCAILYPGLFANCDEASGLCINNPSCAAGTRATANADDPYTGVCTTDSAGTCQSDADCGVDEVCGSDKTCVAKESAEVSFKYVRIDDLSTACKKEKDGKCTAPDPGADIDAIVLVKSDGSTIFAQSVAGYSRSDGIQSKTGLESNVAADPAEALNAPDSFSDYANGAIGGDCVYYKDDAKTVHPYVSLGGVGGYLEVEMGGAIEKGDKLDVLEVGGCKLTNTESSEVQYAQGEEVKVSISVSGDKETWNVIGQKASAKDTNKGLLSFPLSDDTFFAIK